MTDATDTDASDGMTMAQRELLRYVTESQSLAQKRNNNNSNGGAATANKRRRSGTRAAADQEAGATGGMDYHRVRTAQWARIDEMFWRDDAGYDSSDSEDDKKVDGEDGKTKEEDDGTKDKNDGTSDDESSESSTSKEWRLHRRLSPGAYVRCDGLDGNCRRWAVATWIERAKKPTPEPKPIEKEEEEKEEEEKKTNEGGEDTPGSKDSIIAASSNDDPDGDANSDDANDSDAEEWNVCLACQKREFAEEIRRGITKSGDGDGGGDGEDEANGKDNNPSGNTGWPSYVDSVPMTDIHADNTHRQPLPIDLNYGRRLHLTQIHDSPHVYVIDDFLTQGELKHIDGKIADAEMAKTFQRSFVDKGGRRRRRKKENPEETDAVEDGGEEKKEDDDGATDNAGNDDSDNTNNGKKRKRQPADEPQRTSRFIHFGKMADAKIAAIEARAAELLQLPLSSIEPLQLVRYGAGQYFREHHDVSCWL